MIATEKQFSIVRMVASAIRPPSMEEQPMVPSTGKAVNDEAKREVLAALGDARYEFRTVDGIAESSGLQPECVESALKALADVVRESPVPDASGNTLYTLRSRKRTAREIISETRAFLAGSAR